MDNLTHSLVGAALAQAVLPAGAPAPRRRLLIAIGVVSANLPDIDLAYVGITPPPIGYLLHHRGHTHTLVGLVAQALLLAAACRALPWFRRAGADGVRSWIVIAAGLATHILLDWGNSYGVHPFHPFDSRWYYGDAVFILEPWLWMLLGVPVALNAGGRAARAAVLAAIALLPGLMAVVGVIRGGPLAVLAGGSLVLFWCVRRLEAPPRAAAGLGASAAFIVVLFALSAAAEARTKVLLAPEVRGVIVDVVLNPNPADPLCWMAIAVEKDEAAGEYALHRGTLSLVPAWRPPAECASHRFTRGGARDGSPSAWDVPRRHPLARLRDLAERDCAVRAWLQFGRAPILEEREIYDLRFDNGARNNFTTLRLREDARALPCPPHLTRWEMPRADLLPPDPASRRLD